MNERVTRLRKQSIEARPYISTERAELLTDFYRSGGAEGVSTPVARALALRYLPENKTVSINPGEIIVGERGPAPKATPTYPELCCHSLQDLEILGSRERTPFHVSDACKGVYSDKIIPFWKGNTMRERVFASMTKEWKAAFDAGVFTEFMEQRAPGHAILDDKIYRRGFTDFKEDIGRALEKLNPDKDPEAREKQQELEAIRIAADALIRFAERHAEKAEDLAREETDSERRRELERIADICRHVPAHAPRDFREASRCTGSSTSGSSRNSTPGTLSTQAAWISIFTHSM